MVAAALLLTATGAAAIPPPVPPPEAERMALALELWKIRPIADDEWVGALRLAASELSSLELMRAKLDQKKRYFDLQWALTQRITARATAARSTVEALTIECMATGPAYALTVAQLVDLKAFVATPSGKAFWGYNSQLRLAECMREPAQQLIAPTIKADIAALRSKQ